jgi:exosome complex RNA-binding protein Rrp4
MAAIVQSSASSSSIVVPGQLITREAGFVGGRGTYSLSSGGASGEDGDNGERTSAIVACAAGHIERIDKLISVRQIKSR